MNYSLGLLSGLSTDAPAGGAELEEEEEEEEEEAALVVVVVVVLVVVVAGQVVVVLVVVVVGIEPIAASGRVLLRPSRVLYASVASVM